MTNLEEQIQVTVSKESNEDFIRSLLPEDFGQDEINQLNEIYQDDPEQLEKVIALMQALNDYDIDEAVRLIECGDYEVLTDDEADEKASDYILESLWAFKPSFLASATGVDEAVFQAIQDNEKCESNNDAIRSIIDRTCDPDELVKDAIRADGRGHFNSPYDGEELEEQVNSTYYYIYRQN